MLTQSTNSFLPWSKNLAILHKFHHIWSSDCVFFPSWFSFSRRPILQELWKDIGDGLMWKMKPWAYFFISIARRPEGNYFFPLWNRGNVACHHSQLTIFQYEKPFVQAANWNLNRNLLGTNCQSKYQHCVTILQSGAQTNNRFHCKTTTYFMLHWWLVQYLLKPLILYHAP